MEALNFIRFWRPINGTVKEIRAQPCCVIRNTTTEAPKALIVSDHEFDEGDDSFFDLELPVRKFDDEEGNINGNCEKGFESMEEEQTRSVSPNDNFSKRKIIPIETSSKPQSPMTLLKSSAPKFRVFALRKSKSMANKAELFGLSMEEEENHKHEKQATGKHLRVKFNIEESSPNLPIFTRENSCRRTKGKTEESLKDVMQKCLNKFKPLYERVSKKNRPGDKSELSMSSPATVFSIKEKQGNFSTGVKLGKSRSASASSSPLSKRDDSLLLQHDGIQSAILHCKKSLNSSREPSRLSRCTSDSSQEKLSNASSDSSLLSRVTSNSSYEKLMDSARISSEEGNVFQAASAPESTKNTQKTKCCLNQKP